MNATEEIQNELNAELERIAAKTVKDDNKESLSHDLDTNTEEDTVKTVDIDPFLDEALKAGYDPEYKGANRKSPEQFVKDGSFFKKIEAQNKKIEELTSAVKQSLDHNSKLEKAAYAKALKDLESKKEDAILNGDLIKVRAIDVEQKAVHERMSSVPAPLKPELSQDLLDFQERNKEWFNKNSEENIEMLEAADFIDRRIGAQLAAKGQRISQAEHLKLVEDKIRKLYSHRFENVEQKKASLTSRSTTSDHTTSKGLASRLTDQQRNLVRIARSTGSKMTEETYAKQLQLTGSLQGE